MNEGSSSSANEVKQLNYNKSGYTYNKAAGQVRVPNHAGVLPCHNSALMKNLNETKYTY